MKINEECGLVKVRQIMYIVKIKKWKLQLTIIMTFGKWIKEKDEKQTQEEP